MKPFNLEEALAGKDCVTRNGKKAKIVCYSPEYRKDIIFGFVKDEEYWFSHTWCADGSIDIDADHNLDIIGMWEEPQPEVTITFPAPVTQVDENSDYWTFKVTHNGLETFDLKNWPPSYYQDRVDGGFVFKTKEDCQKFLDLMKGAMR